MSQRIATSLVRAIKLAGALSIVMIGSSASAQSYVRLAGTACHPNRADQSKVTYSNQLGIYNDSGNTATVQCAIPSDNAEPFASRIITVNVDDQNSGAGKDVSCSVLGLTLSNDIGFNAGTQKSSGVGQATLYYQFHDYFTYNVSCSIPPALNGKFSRVLNFGTYLDD